MDMMGQIMKRTEIEGKDDGRACNYATIFQNH
jgi:hypothetical protein